MRDHLVAILIFLLAVTVGASAQSNGEDESSASKTQARGYWVDPATGWMWPAKDNGDDISWKGAKKYCNKLRVAGHADWRLPNQRELQSIYDEYANAPGLAGYRKHQRNFTWHVKGNIFLTGEQWSSNYAGDGGDSAYKLYFDFNDGKSNDDPTGWPYPYQSRRALCVRGTFAPPQPK